MKKLSFFPFPFILLLVISLVATVEAKLCFKYATAYVTVTREDIADNAGEYYITEHLINPIEPPYVVTPTGCVAPPEEYFFDKQPAVVPLDEKPKLLQDQNAHDAGAETKIGIDAGIKSPPENVAENDQHIKVQHPAAQLDSQPLLTKESKLELIKVEPIPMSKAPSSFASDLLNAHNHKRMFHGVLPLSWSDELESYAQTVANSYHCGAGLQHTNAPYGENLGVGYSSGQAVVDGWYSEGVDYDYGLANQFNHFSQIVWKETLELGCAVKDCRAQNWGYYIVCNYKKPGNMQGRGKQNILPPVLLK